MIPFFDVIETDRILIAAHSGVAGIEREGIYSSNRTGSRFCICRKYAQEYEAIGKYKNV